jgi:3-hydroxymyristoyl/3-hydroxydecanoyl-(acyl carrier protein) dehydratase
MDIVVWLWSLGLGKYEVAFRENEINPVMPGVLVIEGIAQTAGVLALRLMPPTERRRIMFFVSVDKAKFRKLVRPGDTLEYHAEKVASSSPRQSSVTCVDYGAIGVDQRLCGLLSGIHRLHPRQQP